MRAFQHFHAVAFQGLEEEKFVVNSLAVFHAEDAHAVHLHAVGIGFVKADVDFATAVVFDDDVIAKFVVLHFHAGHFQINAVLVYEHQFIPLRRGRQRQHEQSQRAKQYIPYAHIPYLLCASRRSEYGFHWFIIAYFSCKGNVSACYFYAAR